MKCQHCKGNEATHTVRKVDVASGFVSAKHGVCIRCAHMAEYKFTGQTKWIMTEGVPAAPMAMDRTEFGLDEVTHVPGQMVMTL